MLDLAGIFCCNITLNTEICKELGKNCMTIVNTLCHILSNAYLRDELALKSEGFSGGSFRDLTRVGAPDPELWTELFLMDKEALLPILDRLINRLNDFRSALEKKDEEALRSQLREGTTMKEKLTSPKK